MAKKNLGLNAQAIGEQAINTTEGGAPASSYSSTNEDERSAKKKLISAFVDADAWEDAKIMVKAQELDSVGQLVDISIREYLERNREDLIEYRKYQERRAARKKKQET